MRRVNSVFGYWNLHFLPDRFYKNGHNSFILTRNEVFPKHIFAFWGRFNISPWEHSSPNVKEMYMRDINMANSAHIRMQQCTYTSFQKLQHSCKTTMNLLT
ncbi:hypothetical protein H5410_036921 [Solanum commersonii]|uniref:Uncharacterized protein n=1 Tax=Solanum commersonii TaxID=4109 RepID=A0A9J5Y5N3_SOLCO|nr:hypothetical protein H5410_036921 [Solanum commersonii]